MNLSLVSPNFSTPWRGAGQSAKPESGHDEEDFALGCECANPALQIESWPGEAAAQPLQQLY